MLTLVTLTATHHSSLPAGGYDAVASMDAADTRAALAAMTQPAVEEDEEEILDAAVDAPEMETGDVAVAAEGEVARAVNAAGAATSPPRAPKRRAQRLAYRSPFESELEVSGDASSEDADARRKYRRLKYTRHARSGSMSDSESFDPSSIDPAAFGLEAGAEMSSGGAGGGGGPRTSGLGDAFDSYAALVLEDVAEYGGERTAAAGPPSRRRPHNPAVKLIGGRQRARGVGPDSQRRREEGARVAARRRDPTTRGDRAERAAAARGTRGPAGGATSSAAWRRRRTRRRGTPTGRVPPRVGAAEGLPAEAEAERRGLLRGGTRGRDGAAAPRSARRGGGRVRGRSGPTTTAAPRCEHEGPVRGEPPEPDRDAPGKESEKTDDPMMKALLERPRRTRRRRDQRRHDDGEFHEDQFIAELVDEGLVLAPERSLSGARTYWGVPRGGFDGDDPAHRQRRQRDVRG